MRGTNLQPKPHGQMPLRMGSSRHLVAATNATMSRYLPTQSGFEHADEQCQNQGRLEGGEGYGTAHRRRLPPPAVGQSPLAAARILVVADGSLGGGWVRLQSRSGATWEARAF